MAALGNFGQFPNQQQPLGGDPYIAVLTSNGFTVWGLIHKFFSECYFFFFFKYLEKLGLYYIIFFFKKINEFIKYFNNSLYLGRGAFGTFGFYVGIRIS